MITQPSREFFFPSRRSLLARTAPLLAGALLSGSTLFAQAQSYTPPTMTTLTTERTTHCIGRFLIDLPSNFELRTGGWGDIELYYGLDKNFKQVYATVKPGRYTNEEFWKEVNKKRFELQGMTNIATKGSMLLLGEQIDTSSALLRRLPDEDSASSIKTEVHVLVRDRYVTLEQESYDYTAEPMRRRMDYKNVDPAPAETRLKMIASKLLPYENAARAKPGFCMQGVLFDVGQDDETANFNFYAKDLPDVRIKVDYHAVTGQPSQGVHERVAQGFSEMPQLMQFSAQLRKGDRTLGAGPAQEYLSKTLRPVTQHLFMIERRDDEPRTLERPYFGIKLSTGNEYRIPDHDGQRAPETANSFYLREDKATGYRADNASLSDAQALKLWDDMVASVRKR